MKTALKHICLALLAVGMSAMASSLAGAQTPFEPAAVVNDQAITRFDLDQRLRAQAALTGAEVSQAMVRSVLNGMIADRLRLQAAEKTGIKIPAAQIDSAVETFAAQRGVSVADMSARLRTVGATMQTIRDLVEAELAWREVIRRRYGSRARASDADVSRELELLDGAGAATAVSTGSAIFEIGFLSVAVAPTASAQEVIDANAALKKAQTEIHSCNELSASARDYGPGSGVRSGMSRSDIPAPMVDDVVSLPPGQFSEPVRLVDAVVMAMVCSVENRSASDQRAEELRRDITQRNFGRYADAYLQELQRDAVIEIR